MPDLVQFTRHNDIAVITIDNPPVNALNPSVIEGLARALDQVEQDANTRAAVLVGAGKTFVAGADIKEFGKITRGQSRGIELPALLNRFEACKTPIVAAIHGNAFGGGLEVALACHYRVAAPRSQLGQPEVKLGLIPGAGGTQRLPRIVGLRKGVEMCAEGNPISAAEALNLGLVDRIVEGDLLSGATAFATSVADRPAPSTRERNDKPVSEAEAAAILSAAREAARKKYRNWIAPIAAIDGVEASVQLPFDQALQLERKLFQECLFSDQSKALIHVFFGEREVAKVPDIPKDTPIIPVASAASICSW